LIDTPEKIEKALKLTKISDVWGIGYQLSEKLNKQGVHTTYDFTQMHKGWVRKYMTVVGERLWRELQGKSCLSLETVQPDKKQICTSRCFSQPITELTDMSAAVAGYAGQCAYKLRRQKAIFKISVSHPFFHLLAFVPFSIQETVPKQTRLLFHLNCGFFIHLVLLMRGIIQ